MIGWENAQGAYFINKLEDDISALKTVDGNIQSEIGKLSDLTTTHKDNIVHAVNDNVSAISAVSDKIGTLSNLTTDSKTNAVSAINELNGKIKYVTSFSGKSDGSANKGIEIVGYSRVLVMTAGATADRIGAWIITSNSYGTLTIKRIDSATDSKITISAGSDPFKAIVAYSGTNTYDIEIFAIVFKGNVNETVEGA